MNPQTRTNLIGVAWLAVAALIALAAWRGAK
jgi:hypothetical protein